MPSPQYTIQNWNDQGETDPTAIWADQVDAGVGRPSLEHVETGIYNAHADALTAYTTAGNAIPKPVGPSTNDVIYYNGSAFAAAPIVDARIATGTIQPVKFATNTANQIFRTNAAGTAVVRSSDYWPLRTVLPFHMDSGVESIPSGWAVCNGQTILAANHDLGGGNYVMPDLRNRFALGADPATAVDNTGSGGAAAPGPKGSSGSQSHTILTAELPVHTHSGSADTASDHSHTMTTDSQGAHNHGDTQNIDTATGSNSADHTHQYRLLFLTAAHFGAGGAQADITWVDSYDDLYLTSGITSVHYHTVNAHTHTISSQGTHTHTVTVGSSGAHTHNITVGSTGSGTTYDNRPRFYGQVMIMKVKNV